MKIDDAHYLTEDDRSMLIDLKEFKVSNRHLKIFIASKAGGNARGRGTNRSVILIGNKKEGWSQFMKFFGKNDELRALEAKIIYNNF